MSILVVQHLLTFGQATRILRFFKKKEHSNLGYFFDLQDLGAPMTAAVKLPGLEPYAEVFNTAPTRASWWQENAYLLRVYREVPEKEVPDFTADQLRKLRELADHLLEVERQGGVILD